MSVTSRERKQQEQEIGSLNSALESACCCATAQLAKANKELNRLLIRCPHDLRSPLSTVHGFTAVLQKNRRRKNISEKAAITWTALRCAARWAS
jgi:light-regulated signal transduction histidine kinase (bacteriophytochrome)